MPVIVEQVRRMRGGAQSHLMRSQSKGGADEESYYVVKFQNNPQRREDSGERIARYPLGGAYRSSGAGNQRCRSRRRADSAYGRFGNSNGTRARALQGRVAIRVPLSRFSGGLRSLRF